MRKQYGMRLDENMARRIRALVEAVNSGERVTELPVAAGKADNDKASYDRLRRIMGLRHHLIRVQERRVYLLRAGADESELPPRSDRHPADRYMYGDHWRGYLSCRGCRFHNSNVGCCDYLSITGRRRPCPPRAECTAREAGRHPRIKPLSL